jgi:hypothetical protein
MPPVECAQHLLGYLWKWGPTLAGSMGQVALSHVDLVACQSNTGIDLTPWEAETLVRLSREYLGESSAATKPDREPPFQSADAARLHAHRMQKQLDEFFR